MIKIQIMLSFGGNNILEDAVEELSTLSTPRGMLAVKGQESILGK